ncbi:DUF4232 domain-containing protein [Myceligenerans salitolerans]|uniref:DUF4232 domain-containing protein n=1 Tax=Myceligenerans salitolerans TaxID=1230528 RepID=A0ABS3ICR0_9MICO|nr:DUF4232 domain-containing protein [Myceligenerans salitolerans]MBO0610764.1 DUF4232 domain-containing protein [Myceligenerans salitolerans]
MDDSPDAPDRSTPAYGPGSTDSPRSAPAPHEEAARVPAPPEPEPRTWRPTRVVAWSAGVLAVLIGTAVVWQAVQGSSTDVRSLPAVVSQGPSLPPEAAALRPEVTALLRAVERVDGVAATHVADGEPSLGATGIVVDLATPLPGPVESQAVAHEALAVVQADDVYRGPVTFEATMPGSGADIVVTYVLAADGTGTYASLGDDPVSDAVVLIAGAHPVGRVTHVGLTPDRGAVLVSEPGTLRSAADEARRLHLPAGSFRVADGPGEWIASHRDDAEKAVPPDAGLAMIEQVAVIEDVTTAIYVPDSHKNSGLPYFEVIIQADPVPVAELLDTVGYADQLGYPVRYKVWGIGETGETSLTGWVSGRTADGAGGGDGAADGVAGVAACTSDVVRLELPWTDAATGQRYLGVRATNRSDGPCALGRRPEISFLAADGSAPDILLEPVGEAGEPVVLRPGESADSMIQWGAGSTAGGAVLTTAVLVTLPGDDEPVRLPVTDIEGIAEGIDLLHGAKARLEPWSSATDREADVD